MMRAASVIWTVIAAQLTGVAAADGGFSLPNWGDLTIGGALVGFAVLVLVSIVRGWLIPKAQHDRELAAANQRTVDANARGDEWKATALELKAVVDRKDAQVDTLVQTNAVVQDILREASPRSLGTTEPLGGG